MWALAVLRSEFVYFLILDLRMLISLRRKFFYAVTLITVALFVVSWWSVYRDELLWLKVGSLTAL